MNLPDKIERDLFLPVDIDRVWQAISTPVGLSRWFSNQATFEAVEGSPLKFVWNDHGTSHGRIEKIDPPTQFVYRWRAHGVPDSEPLSAQNSTLVTFSLAAVAGGTQLTVVETGFSQLSTAARENNYQENVAGWRSELQELAEYLTSVTA